ncbi:MAG TPA: lysophospholipase [Gemmatimonadales bacterium]|nr:lysophospholipase [Gemmatimonadales bacterium]
MTTTSREGSHDSDSWYEGADGARLFCRRCPARGIARATVLALHGLGDHSGLYPMLGEALAPRGIAVDAPDLRGNGRSPGQRGYINSWSELRDDLHCLVRRARAESSAPLFLLGNSLGGLVVLDYAAHHPEELRGVVAIAPPLGSLGVPAPLLALGRVLSRVWPRFSLETGMDLSGLSRDPAAVAEVLNDPLFHRRGTARLSTEITATIARVQRAAPTFPVPLLVVHGAADRMVSPDGSRGFVARAGQADKQLLEVPGGYHALLADLDRERVLAAIGDWITARL